MSVKKHDNKLVLVCLELAKPVNCVLLCAVHDYRA